MGLFANLLFDWFFEVPEPYNNGAGEDFFQYLRKHPEERRKLNRRKRVSDHIDERSYRRWRYCVCGECGYGDDYYMEGSVHCHNCGAMLIKFEIEDDD